MEINHGYSQTEIGMIPSDWGVMKFTDCAELKHGFQFRDKHFTRDGIKVTKIGNLMDGGGLSFDDVTFIDSNSMKIFSRYLLFKGDVLMALTGASLGKVSIVDTDEKSLQNYRVGKFLNKNNSSLNYIYYLLQSIYIQKKIKSLVNEAAQPNLGKKDFDKFIVPLPPTKAEQTAIAQVLSDTDELISSLEKLIEKKKLIKQGTMQQLLTGKKRLPGFSEEWRKINLNSECEIITKGTTPTSIGKEFKRRGINFLKIESLSNDNRVREDMLAFIDIDTNNLLKRSQLKHNDILFSIAGALGRVCVVSKNLLPANTNQALAIIRLKENSNLDQMFLFYFLRSSIIEKHYKSIFVQGAQSNLSLINVRDFPILCPSKGEQIAISKILMDIDKEMEILEQKLKKYKSIKQGMMQNLLTGKIRLV